MCFIVQKRWTGEIEIQTQSFFDEHLMFQVCQQETLAQVVGKKYPV